MTSERPSQVDGVARRDATPVCVLRDQAITYVNPQLRRVFDLEPGLVDEVTETASLGETFFPSATGTPRYDDEGNVVGVTADATDHHERERQNERLGEFTEALAHDLRNPLNVAQAHVALLREEDDDPSLAKIDESLERVSSLIDEFRSFVVDGRTVDSPDAVDLDTVARDAWQSVETGDADLAVTATDTVRADPDRLRRLLEHVYRDAIERGREGSETGGDRSIAVTIGSLDRGFYVADDGPGIPDERREAVFDGFTTDSDRTGFGLAIVRTIARAHDWDVTATGSREDGAKFEFTGVARVESDGDDRT